MKVTKSWSLNDVVFHDWMSYFFLGITRLKHRLLCNDIESANHSVLKNTFYIIALAFLIVPLVPLSSQATMKRVTCLFWAPTKGSARPFASSSWAGKSPPICVSYWNLETLNVVNKPSRTPPGGCSRLWGWLAMVQLDPLSDDSVKKATTETVGGHL